MSSLAILEAATLTSMAAVGYHHALYPMIMAWIGRHPSKTPKPVSNVKPPSITIIMPAYNEADFIRQKIENLASLDYPTGSVTILIGCDGSVDGTGDLAAKAVRAFPLIHFHVQQYPRNRGKVAVLNDLIQMADGEIVVLTDVSAMLPKDCLKRIASHFDDPRIGAVGATYTFANTAGGHGESSYWHYQTAIKRGESRIGALIGAHGACYAIRRLAFEPLEQDTINDDFIIPMRVGLKGYRTVYDPEIIAKELEQSTDRLDFQRRMRIGAGNMQQVLRLLPQISWRKPGFACAFISGKALRLIMGPALLLTLLGSLTLADQSHFFLLSAAAQLSFYLLAGLGALIPNDRRPKSLGKVVYFVSGHLASSIGALRYRDTGPKPARQDPVAESHAAYMSRETAAAKRVFDIIGALGGLGLTAVLFPLIALLIKWESPGPVLFKQLRVGRALDDRIELFEMIKFRSMRTDAEAQTGPVWAERDDPRINRIGRFLRKTRLDELPQFLNVLRGDMSLIGPRPERPGFYNRLEESIPYYTERTFGLRPGITGLAQVNQGYDRDTEDVRRKVMFDHAYAVSITRFSDWIKTDIAIFGQTLLVMALGRGQ